MRDKSVPPPRGVFRAIAPSAFADRLSEQEEAMTDKKVARTEMNRDLLRQAQHKKSLAHSNLRVR